MLLIPNAGRQTPKTPPAVDVMPDRQEEDSAALSVLLVEDDEIHASVCTQMLRYDLAEHQIEHVKTLAAARQKIMGIQLYDIILLDMQLPDGVGSTLLASCAQFQPQAPVIVLTAHDSEEMALGSVRMGAEDYLVKGEYNQKMLMRSIRYARHRRCWQQDRAALNLRLEYERQANQRHRDFVAMMAHEFRTPLALIDSSVQLIQRAKSPESAVRQIDTIALACQRLVRMLSTGLAFLQIEGAEELPEHEEVDVEALLETSLTYIHRLYPKHRVQRIGSPCTEPMTGYRGMIELAMVNMLQNAAKFSSPDTVITIETRLSDGCLVLLVHDYGIGVPQEDLPRIGECFFRASNARHISGTGMGLYLLTKTARLLEGSFVLESKKDEGTTATLILPYIPCERK